VAISYRELTCLLVRVLLPLLLTRNCRERLSLTLRPTVSRPVRLEIKHPSGVTTRSLLLSDSCGFVDLGRPLWREDGSVVYNYSWPSPAQSFSVPSPVGLVAIFYCLIFETERILSLTYIAAERIWTYSKHISRDRYPASLLACRSDLQKTQIPLFLHFRECLQSCCLATRWSNPLQ
jgi:hypothetical protein